AYYNKEIYDKFNLPIPKTHEEYIEGLKTIRDSGEDIIPMAFGNSTAWPSASHSEILANRIGGNEPFDKLLDGSGKWTDESFVKAASLLQEMADEKL
ncbi:ABC transporter substrate-binding protein, partial [Blautia hominis]|nr:ABC transporter substrate-binding protein [Blautia hominis]